VCAPNKDTHKGGIFLYGYLITKGKSLRFYQEQVLDLSLLRCEIPARSQERQERKALNFLRRAGVKELLNPPQIRHTFRLTSTGELYRHKAAELALLELERQSIPPERAVIGLRANRWNRDMAEACQHLAPTIRAFALELPQREEIVWQLQRQYGIPILRGGGDITLCFTPAQPGKGRLLLGGERPELKQFTFSAAGVELPEGCPVVPLLAVLCETGRLEWDRVKVIPLPGEKEAAIR
jgi:hypothetical protein